MARARGSNAGFGWALAIFGSGFFICLVLALVFWLQVADADERAIEAEQALSRFAKPNERSGPEIDALLNDRSRSVVRHLLDQNSQLKQMINSDPLADVEGLKAYASAQGLENAVLFDEIERLRAELDAANKARAAAASDRDAAMQRADAAEQSKADLRDQFAKATDEARSTAQTQISKAQQALDSVEGLSTEARNEVNRVIGESNARIAELETQANQQLVEITRLQKTIRDLTPNNRAEVPAIAQPDGRIVSLVTGGDRVYIDRGRADNARLGLTFEVFDSGELIKLDLDDPLAAPRPLEELRGKATIEVINLSDNSAIARVVRRQRNATIEEGDAIVNLAYDPAGQQKVYVYGDFDIEGTGDPSKADARRVESMVTRSGGILADELAYDVDYLVLGVRPPLPEPLAPGTIDPTAIAEHVEAMQNYETYQTLSAEAKKLSVPVLNQNRFLALMGYYDR